MFILCWRTEGKREFPTREEAAIAFEAVHPDAYFYRESIKGVITDVFVCFKNREESFYPEKWAAKIFPKTN